METVLIATLGEAPVVVPGMINVLRDRGVELDRVQILYPDELNERFIPLGYELIAEHLAQRGPAVEPQPLPFADASTEADSLAFLQILNALLEAHQRAGNRVYLSLSGGRKHLSALLGVLTQFYPCIEALYHLHDTQADNPRKQFTVEQLDRMSSDERQRRLDPPADRFVLVKLPHQPLADGAALARWLAHYDEGEIPAPVPITPEAESFYGRLFQGRGASDPARLELWLTQTAYDQYCDLEARGSDQIATLGAYFKDMPRPAWLAERGVHYQATDRQPGHVQEGNKAPLVHFVCKKARTAERVFFYTQQHPITAYGRKPVEQVVVTRFAVHTSEAGYDLELDDWVHNADIAPRFRPSELPKRPIMLIAPLGESPMVATQAYRLLQERGESVRGIAAVYPDQHEPARNGAARLRSACMLRKVPVELYPLPIADLVDDASVDIFVAGLRRAVAEARQRYAGAVPALLLAGGRKGMSALALYVAQVEGIGRVYHTTIRDPQRERAIVDRYEALASGAPPEQAAFMFLDSAALGEFELIDVPVIGLSAGS